MSEGIGFLVGVLCGGAGMLCILGYIGALSGAPSDSGSDHG
jgi:hypothetical protein